MMRAVVLYDTVFGNTERIGNALARGLRKARINTDCFNITDISMDKIGNYDFIAVGAPTQFETASSLIKQFLGRLANREFEGKYAFAFDTRLDDIWAGSAAEYIEKKLASYGLQILKPRSSASVVWEEKKIPGQDEPITQANIRPEMENSFEAIGLELGEMLRARPNAK